MPCPHTIYIQCLAYSFLFHFRYRTGYPAMYSTLPNSQPLLQVTVVEALRRCCSLWIGLWIGRNNLYYHLGTVSAHEPSTMSSRSNVLGDNSRIYSMGSFSNLQSQYPSAAVTFCPFSHVAPSPSKAPWLVLALFMAGSNLTRQTR